MDDAFLAHAVVGYEAASPEERIAKALRLTELQPRDSRPFGRTWRARDAGGALVSLVVLDPDSAKQERDAFARSIVLLHAGGELPGVLRIRAVAPSRDAYVADLWTTGSARDLSALAWPLRRRLQFVRDVCLALDRLHAAGLVHGALCPDNVLLDDDLRPVVAEAGHAILSALAARHVDARSYVDNAAPEVRHGETPTVRSDVFSVGRVLQQVLADLRHSDAGHAGVAADPGRAVVDPIVERCVALSPAARYASCREVAGALDDAVERLHRESSSPAPRLSAASIGRERPSLANVHAVARPRSERPSGVRWPAVAGVTVFVAASLAALVVFGARVKVSPGSARPAIARPASS